MAMVVVVLPRRHMQQTGVSYMGRRGLEVDVV